MRRINRHGGVFPKAMQVVNFGPSHWPGCVGAIGMQMAFLALLVIEIATDNGRVDVACDDDIPSVDCSF